MNIEWHVVLCYEDFTVGVTLVLVTWLQQEKPNETHRIYDIPYFVTFFHKFSCCPVVNNLCIILYF